jgi:hypothetical protein
MAKIGITTLRRIILEEIQSLREGDEEDSAASLGMAASKLLKALEAFKESATEKSKADLGTHMEEMEKSLKRIVSSPMQYVDAPKKLVKKVNLKPTNIV